MDRVNKRNPYLWSLTRVNTRNSRKRRLGEKRRGRIPVQQVAVAPGFDLELQLLSVWSFTCSLWGFSTVCFQKNINVGALNRSEIRIRQRDSFLLKSLGKCSKSFASCKFLKKLGLCLKYDAEVHFKWCRCNYRMEKKRWSSKILHCSESGIFIGFISGKIIHTESRDMMFDLSHCFYLNESWLIIIDFSSWPSSYSHICIFNKPD